MSDILTIQVYKKDLIYSPCAIPEPVMELIQTESRQVNEVMIVL